MGIKVRTIKEVTCDICGVPCGEHDGDIRIEVSDGDTPTTIEGRLTFTRPYCVTDGVICLDCKKEYLAAYLKQLGMAV
jgi:hypothetical protein